MSIHPQAESSSSAPPPSLKTLLSAAKELLKPPEPLPSSPVQLRGRLVQVSRLLPSVWKVQSGWDESEEVEEIGDTDEVGGDPSDIARRRRRRDQLVFMVGKRCLSLVVGMQELLEKEFLPVEQRGGLQAKDFLLGTADLRVVRLLLTHSIASYLLPQAVRYTGGLASGQIHSDEFSKTIIDLLSILQPKEGPSDETPRLVEGMFRPVDSSSTPRILPPTTVAQTLTNSHLPPILLCSILLGYTPTAPAGTHRLVREVFQKTLNHLSPTQCIASLGAGLRMIQIGKTSKARGWSMKWPAYVEDVVGTCMSAQMRRTGGIKAVMENVFGEAGSLGDTVDEKKLEHVANVLSRVPKGYNEETYLPTIIAILIKDLIQPSTGNPPPIIHVRAACYTIHRLWSTSKPCVLEAISQTLHVAWHPSIPQNDNQILVTSEQIRKSIELIHLLILHNPPSPSWTDYLVSPILPALFALHFALDRPPKSDQLRQLSIKARCKLPEQLSSTNDDIGELLSTWGRVVGKEEGVKGFWSIIRDGWGGLDETGRKLFWDVREGDVSLVYGSPSMNEQLSFHSEENLFDSSALLDQLDISPNPQAFTRLLKSIDRTDIASELFLKVLTEWRIRSRSDETDPMSSMLYLQLTMAMIEQLGEKLLKSPNDVLLVVEGVLADEAESLQSGNGVQEALVEIVGGGQVSGNENDDDAIGRMGMVETAISLLLSSLDANEGLNQINTPILLPIDAHLEVISKKTASENTKRVTREALLLLLLRRASHAPQKSSKTISEDVKTYQQALKLISDPILPVRAHGLILLSDLPKSTTYDHALTPGIMDIFMKSLQDEDSYIYLNAVKGLAGMVDYLGKEVFTGLMRGYDDSVRELGRGNGGKDDQERLDKVLRMAEALSMVVRRSGKAFGVYAAIMIPLLSKIFPNQALPTVVRSSSLSVLSSCAEADHLPLLAYASDLMAANIDLIQIESVPSSSFRQLKSEETISATDSDVRTKPKRKVVLVEDDEPEIDDEEEEKHTTEIVKPRIIDTDPVNAGDSKHPALRRSALAFLGHLVLALLTEQEEKDEKALDRADLRDRTLGLGDGGFELRLPGQITVDSREAGGLDLDVAVLKRARHVLSYVALTDDDEIVRSQAKEVDGLLSELRTSSPLVDSISSITIH